MSGPVEFVGAPVDIGAEVFTKLCMPVIREASTKLQATPKQMAQLYVGFLSACMGSMMADFGQDGAARIVSATLDAFESKPFDGATQNH